LKKNILWICIIALISIAGCSSGSEQPPGSTSNIAQKIPFVIFLQNTEEQNNVYSDSASLFHFDIASGEILAEDTPLFKRTSQGDYNSNDFRMIWDGEKDILIMDSLSSFELESLNPVYKIKELRPSDPYLCEVIKNTGEGVKVYTENSRVIVEFENGNKQILTPQLPNAAVNLQPLLISGDEHNYQVLVSYDVLSSKEKNTMVGKLLIANINEGKVSWKEVRGEYCSFIAGAGSYVAQVGNEIFTTGCGNVMILDLNKVSPVLEAYKPINNLIAPLRDKFTEAPINPQFGVYKDCLLVSVQNFNEKWLWFLRNGVYLGGVHINTLKNQIETNLDGKEIETKNIPSKVSIAPPQLPVDGYGAWK